MKCEVGQQYSFQTKQTSQQGKLPWISKHINNDKRISIQEEITIANIYASNSTASKFEAKLTEVKQEIDKFPIIFGDFAIPLSVIYIQLKQAGNQ